MGYHIIIKAQKANLIKYYADNFEDLVEFSDIQLDSIIYQGEPKWEPIIIGEHKTYKNLADAKFRAGIKAEKLFTKQATKHGLMLEKLSQDPESFKLYTSNADNDIKRGDFLIRNVKNIEIEVKCLSYYNFNNEDCVYINYDKIIKHKHMQSLTECPVFFAIYRRENDSPVENSLNMIPVDKIFEENNKTVSYDDTKKCFIVPISLTTKKFDLIDEIRKKIKIPKNDF